MNLYLIERIHDGGWDTYDSMVVAAPDNDSARRTHPNDGYTWGEWITAHGKVTGWGHRLANGAEHLGGYGWVSPNEVNVTFLGTAAEETAPGVICASFNAG